MPSSRQEFTATEIRAGFLVMASLVILALFLVVLSGWRPGDPSARTFVTSFTDVAGLAPGASVRFGGVEAGRVTAVEPDPEDRSRIRVTVVVRSGVPVNGDSVASIGQVSLTSEKHLEISTGSRDAPLLADGAVLKSGPSTGGLIDMPEMEGVVARLESLLDGLNALVGGGPAEGGTPDAVDLPSLFGSLKTTLDEGAGTARRMNTILDENHEAMGEVLEKLAALEDSGARLLDRLEGVVAGNGPTLERSMANLERATGEMADRMEELEEALRSFQRMGASGADLMEGQRATVEEILLNLQVMTRHLAGLSRMLTQKSNALVFGAGRGHDPGEDGR